MYNGDKVIDYFDVAFIVCTTACVLLAGGLWLHYHIMVDNLLPANQTKRSAILDEGESEPSVRGNMKLFLEDGSTVNFYGMSGEGFQTSREEIVEPGSRMALQIRDDSDFSPTHLSPAVVPRRRAEEALDEE